jgi:nucleoside-diphosphate-sugar epimerase
MRVLLTGAFGNVGINTLYALLDAGYTVRCFDIKTPGTVAASQTLLKSAEKNPQRASRFEIVWGDICDDQVVKRISSDVGAVIHLAAVFPPVSERNEELAYRINVVATKNLLTAIRDQSPAARFIFASSVGVYGYQNKQSPPKSADDPVNPVNAYGRQKVVCEELIKNSGLDWVIMRLGVCFDSKFALSANLATMRMQFAVAPDIRIEQVHPKDVATALTNAISAEDAKNKILLIGGGRECRTTSGELIQSIFDVVGIRLPSSIYGSENFYTEWIDTAESQRILRYQHHTLSETVAELQHKLRFARMLIFPLRPIAPVVFERILRSG